MKRESHSHFSGTTPRHLGGIFLGLIFKFIISITSTVRENTRNLLLHRIYGNEILDFRKFNSCMMGWSLAGLENKLKFMSLFFLFWPNVAVS